VKTKGKTMSETETPVADMQTLTNGAVLNIGGKRYTVDVPADYPDQLWLKGTRGGVFFLREVLNREGLYHVVSWNSNSGAPVVNKGLQPLKVLVMGNIVEDVTGKKLTI
jgi:hypothetical protein